MLRRISNRSVGRIPWVLGALLVACGVGGACGGNVSSHADGAHPPLDGGSDAAPDGYADADPDAASADADADAGIPIDAVALDGATDAGCSILLDAAQMIVDDLVSQYDSCEEAGDCVAVPVFGNCAIVSAAESTGFFAALAQANQDFESAGCSATSISCDAVQVKCEGRCTSDGTLILGP